MLTGLLYTVQTRLIASVALLGRNLIRRIAQQVFLIEPSDQPTNQLVGGLES